MIKETIYLNRDNTVDLLLLEDGKPIDLTSATKIEVIDTACAWAVNSVDSPDAFEIGTTDGKIILKLGHEPIAPDSYTCRVIVYDAQNADGVVWENTINLVFKNICTVTPQ